LQQVVANPVNAAQLLPPGMPRLGFGCGDLHGAGSRAQSLRLIQTAIDQGIQYFDLARLYGNGSAEGVMGSILPKLRSRLIIASKAGIVPYSMLHGVKFRARVRKALRLLPPARALIAPPVPSSARFGAFTLPELTRSVHCSLRELRTDYLDVLLLHECSPADAQKAQIADFLERLRVQGKIRAFGIATHFPDTCRILSELPQAAQVAQFASDAMNRNVRALPRGRTELVITHTPIKQALPRLVAHLATDQAAATRWRDRTGLAADDRAGIARLLLADAMAENADGMVLFSTARPERIVEARTFSPTADALTALNEELCELRARTT
jgi:D-threo-aldose 1-dehydrogenase